jgi:hypothetical protein
MIGFDLIDTSRKRKQTQVMTGRKELVEDQGLMP